MKIDNNLKTLAPARAKETKAGRTRVLVHGEGGPGVRDEVALTGDAAKMRELDARLAELEITDAGKIESVRQAIADGTFKVDEEAVADAMVNETLDHLGRRA
ncbi:MAG: flagellar biosynthesis anti-sigma factor FlgM [Pseudomonadota bacterium]